MKKLLMILLLVLVVLWLLSLTIKPVSKGDCEKWLVSSSDWVCVDGKPGF